jgi:hypothetical protein
MRRASRMVPAHGDSGHTAGGPDSQETQLGSPFAQDSDAGADDATDASSGSAAGEDSSDEEGDDGSAHELSTEEAARARRIKTAVTKAKTLLQALEESVVAQLHSVPEAELKGDFEEARAAAYSLFAARTRGLGDGQAVIDARTRLEARAARLWDDVRAQNRDLYEIEQGQAAAGVAIGAFDSQRAALVAAMPMSRLGLLARVQAHRATQLQWLRERLRGSSARAFGTASWRLNGHVDAERDFFDTTNQRAIVAQASAAADAALQRLQEAREAAAGRGPGMPDADLHQSFNKEAASVLALFDEMTTGLQGEAAVSARRREVDQQAAATWRAIRADLLRAAASQGTFFDRMVAFVLLTGVGREQEQVLATASKSHLPKRQAVGESGGEKKPDAVTKAKQAPSGGARRTTGVGARSAPSRVRPPAPTSGGGIDSDSDSESDVDSSSMPPIHQAPAQGGRRSSSAPLPLGRQPAGTPNARVSKSVGHGFGVDRNGRPQGGKGGLVTGA